MISPRFTLLAALALAMPATAVLAHPGHQHDAGAAIAAALANPDRPKDDTARDANRQAAAVLAFTHVRPGAKVADLIAGGGYFTRLFAGVVGPKGHVYSVLPAELAAKWAKAKPGNEAMVADPHFKNISSAYPDIA
ncbi:MAG: methyltransferase, partial [Proteobacteria bacterium]|nr:methyltransferase [Pseudomonadota bacterium]